MITKRLRNSYKRIIKFYLRNNNQIMIIKAVRKLLKFKMNYAISITNPDNHKIFNGLEAEIHLLRDAEIFNDIGTTAGLPIPQYYKEEFLLRLKNTIIDTETGIAFTEPNDPVAILESSNILAMEVSDYLRPRKPKNTYEGEWTVLSYRSYGHWLLQDIPRFLRLIDIVKNPKVAISSGSPKYVRDFLHILNIEPKLVGPVFQPETYICISSQYQIGNPSVSDIQTLRKFRDDNAKKYFEDNAIKNVYGDKIFISRRYSNRPLPNELLLEEIARSKNFQIVYLESMSFADEILLFMNAEVIVGATGGGLSNIVWIDEKKCRKVVEIYNTNFDHQATSQLARRINVPYYRVLYTSAIDMEDIWD